MDNKEHKSVQSSNNPLIVSSLKGIGIFPYSGFLKHHKVRNIYKNASVQTDMLVELKIDKIQKDVGVQYDINDIVDNEWCVIMNDVGCQFVLKELSIDCKKNVTDKTKI